MAASEELSSPKIPEAAPGDPEDVSWALSTAEAMWSRGDHAEGIKWVRKAAEAASDADDDSRALVLAKAASELASIVARVAEGYAPALTAVLSAPSSDSDPSFAPRWPNPDSAATLSGAPDVESSGSSVQPASSSRAQTPPAAPSSDRLGQAPRSGSPPAIASGKPPPPKSSAPGSRSVPPPAPRSSSPSPPAAPQKPRTIPPAPIRQMSGLVPLPARASSPPPVRQSQPPPTTRMAEDAVPSIGTSVLETGPQSVVHGTASERALEPSTEKADDPSAATGAPETMDMGGSNGRARRRSGPETTEIAVVAPSDSERQPSINAPRGFPSGEMNRVSLEGDRMTSTFAAVPSGSIPPVRPSSGAVHDPRIQTSQAVRVIVWRDANGVHIAPAGTVVSSITIDAVLVGLEPTADLTAWLSQRMR